MSYVTKEVDNEIVKLLKAGAIGFMPSDTIYGLSARALDKMAVEKLHTLKGRTSNKPFIILISDISQLELFDISIPELPKNLWPGPLSIIFDAPDAPKWLQRGTGSLAIRLPAHNKLRKLIAVTGPLLSTSANPEGQPPANIVEEAKEYFGDKLDFYIDAGEIVGEPSTIAKLTAGKLEILRQGAATIS